MKTVLVTGASSGIGEATARKLVEDGYTVYVAARRLEKMNALVERGATAVQMDVAREEDVRRAV
ncbi:MAG: SDR family NAD(P)-dependent oxidoreductase, partial [Spirochaetaceae bacterium]|nr:SDR family NAD(P)-dependent oxidoreductase [Spirochaetaceae bacterium]